jgi:ABC-2 type transport system ATP-binding protein
MADRADRALRGYSKGMRQRTKLAQALLPDPPLLVLDEPLSGIDPVGRAELVALFRDLAGQGKCLLVSSHELDELEKLTSHVVIMARGRVVAADTVGRIRERLAHHPVTVRIDVRIDGERDPRALGSLLLKLPVVASVELAENAPVGVGRLLVRVHSAAEFYPALNRIVLEGWFDVVHLGAVDGSAQAVLSYLLAGRR